MPIEPVSVGSVPPPRARVPRTFRAINGLRGPGALAIAFAHFAVATELLAYQHLETVLVVVDMFFVFSGIVIAQAYAEKLARPSGFPGFIVRRVGRIWPMQASMLGILVAYELAKLAMQTVAGTHFSTVPFSGESGTLLQAIPTNLLLIHSLGIHDRETWNFPSWSLSVEFITYILFALFCLVRPRWRHVLSIFAILASVSVLIFIAPYHMRSTFDFGIFRCIAGFLAGTLIQEIATRWEIPRYPLPTLVECLAVALLGIWIVRSVDSDWAYAAPLVISLFLMCFVAERGAISRLLASKPLQLLAEASFSIYMVHGLVLIFLLAGLHVVSRVTGQALFIDIVNPLAGRPGATATVQVLHAGNAAKGAIGIVFFAAVALATYLTYRWIEVPGRAAFGRFAKRFEGDALRSSPRLPADVKPADMKSWEGAP